MKLLAHRVCPDATEALAHSAGSRPLGCAAYQAGHTALPEGLSGLRAAEVVLDFLPKFCMRVARMRLKMGDFREVTAVSDQPHRVWVTLHGSPGLEIGLACDRPFALPVVAATCSQDATRLDDGLIGDGLGEFLNVLGGNAMSALEKESIYSNLGPPCLKAELREGWEFQTAAAEGKAWLVLRRLICCQLQTSLHRLEGRRSLGGMATNAVVLVK